MQSSLNVPGSTASFIPIHTPFLSETQKHICQHADMLTHTLIVQQHNNRWCECVWRGERKICMCWQTFKKRNYSAVGSFPWWVLNSMQWSVCVCVRVCWGVCICAVSKKGTLQLKPFREALSAWIGLETQFFIGEFGVDNRSWLQTAEQQFCSLRKWEGESNEGWRDGEKGKTKEEPPQLIHSKSGRGKSLHWK